VIDDDFENPAANTIDANRHTDFADASASLQWQQAMPFRDMKLPPAQRPILSPAAFTPQ
jgi:hypothetical protein